jgi:hypothetical protein
MNNSAVTIKVKKIQDLLLRKATGGDVSTVEYEALRRDLIAIPSLKGRLPDMVLTYRDLAQFWNFIQPKFQTYQERREYIWSQFTPLLDSLEDKPEAPSDPIISGVVASFDVTHVYEIWQRALDRRNDDPEGAITAARTLLESVCKHILDHYHIEYEDFDLPRLYHATAEQLSLSPSQHTEKVFKQILGSCQSVVEGLGSIRNKLGDAHGKGRQPVKPAPRHAELAVNLAGSMALFLIRTWEARIEIVQGEQRTTGSTNLT